MHTGRVMNAHLCDAKPVFWQRQPRLPAPVMRFLKVRLEAALRDSQARADLVWPTVLGAPGLLEAHPKGIPEPRLLAEAKGLLATLGRTDVGEAWQGALRRHPDTAEPGDSGWLPHRIWAPLAGLVSLRSGVTLLALTGNAQGPRRSLAAGVGLFNCALFHECHDAFEERWVEAQGDLKRGLQGLIMLAGAFHHQQHHNPAGMLALLRDAERILEPFPGRLETPWGAVGFEAALEAGQIRLQWLQEQGEGCPLEPLWDMARPELEIL